MHHTLTLGRELVCLGKWGVRRHDFRFGTEETASDFREI